MNAFNESLGVECNYCHVQEGPGGRNDFASDEKREKRVARQMILLRDSINVIIPAVVGKPAGAGPTSGSGDPGAPVRVLSGDGAGKKRERRQARRDQGSREGY